jgi:hypothetical protein
VDRPEDLDLAALTELAADDGRQPQAGRLAGLRGRLGRPDGLLGRLPPSVLSGAAACLVVVGLAVVGTSLVGRPTGAAASPVGGPTGADAHGVPAAGHAAIVAEPDPAPPRPTARPIATRPPPAVSPTASPAPIWEPRESGWVARGVPPLQPPHLFPAERLRLLEGGDRARTIEVTFRVLLKSGSTAPLWGVLLGYHSELEHTRLQFFTDDYDGGRPYVALYVAKGGKDGTVTAPQRVLDYDFWGRDSHKLIVQIGDQQVRAVLDGRQLGRWPNPGITAASKGLYLLGGSRMEFESFAAR